MRLLHRNIPVFSRDSLPQVFDEVDLPVRPEPERTS
jgi:hypothetical protein